MSSVNSPDLLVIGAGPAGLSAAIEAASAGLETVIVDEGVTVGGQLVKQTHKFFGNEGFFASVRGFEIAQKLLKGLLDLENVEILQESSVIGVYEDGIPVLHLPSDTTRLFRPKRVVVATGASEKFLQFENNDLPGVYGAGAVQTLMNQFGIMPGKNVLMIGSGNIGLIVSYQLVQAGVNVKAIVEIADRIGGYEVHADKVKRLGIPVLLKHTVTKAFGVESVEGAEICEVDEKFSPILSTAKELAVDTVCIAVGLNPSVELIAQAGGQIRYIAELGGYVPTRDEDMRTTAENFFVAGDVSGIEEATTAMIEGRIAGLSVVRDLKGSTDENKVSGLRRELVGFRNGPTSSRVREGLQKLGFDVSSGESRSGNPNNPHKHRGKLRPIIECFEAIPCNPCETSCPTGAIIVGDNINDVPVIDYEKCNGCGICMTKCPGLAIFMLQELPDQNSALIGIPYELIPLPSKGDQVHLLGRQGEILAEGTVQRVFRSPHKTNGVYVKVPLELADRVRSIRPILQEDNAFVCRCEELTVSDIEAAIDEGYTDFEELRRKLRISMGPCGGRTCRLNALRILSRKTGKSIEELSFGVLRPPSIPSTFGSIANQEGAEDD